MKLLATLALVVALLVVPVSQAAANTFTLSENFPYQQGDNGFSVGAWNPLTHTYTALVPYGTGGYSFARDNTGVTPTVQRLTDLRIQMVPSASEYAVLSGHPSDPELIDVSWGFSVPSGASAVHVMVGTFANNTPTVLWNSSLGGAIGPTAGSSLSNLYLTPDISLFFAVEAQGDPGASATFLGGTITSNPVPIPGALLLLGSGLLGLAGWRRKFGKN